MIKDGLVMMYVKDGTLYPVALSKDQATMFELMTGLLPQPIVVAFKHPQGDAVDLKPEIMKGLKP